MRTIDAKLKIRIGNEATKVLATIVMVVLLMGLTSWSTAQAEIAWFVVESQNPPDGAIDSFVIPMSDPDDIAKARNIVQSGSGFTGEALLIEIAEGSDGNNIDSLNNNALWSWHVIQFNGFSQVWPAIVMPYSATQIESELSTWMTAYRGSLIMRHYQIASELPITSFSHSQIIDTCVTCHDGSQSIGKPINHLPSSLLCDACHTTVLFTPAKVDHAQIDLVGNACVDCHVKQCAGLCVDHIVSSEDCSACHTYAAWAVIHNEIAGDCVSCHNSTDAIGKALDHPQTSDNCAQCHYTTTFVSRLNAVEPAVLLKEVNPNGNVSPILNIYANLGNFSYFWADDGARGTELWRTDGTPIGTDLFIDIVPGIASPYALGSGIPFIVSANDRIFFPITTDLLGTELWVSDGTEVGTFVLKDIRTGSQGGRPNRLTVVGNDVYFSIDNMFRPPAKIYTSNELWKTDGTSAGTFMVKNFGNDNSWTQSINMPMYDGNGKLFFTVGNEVWVSDGSDIGTKPITSLHSELLRTDKIYSVTDQFIYFLGFDSGNVSSLWVTDGSAGGTKKVMDNAIAISSSPHFDKKQNLLHFFLNMDNATQLWVSDGSVVGTKLIEEIPHQDNLGASNYLFQSLDADRIVFAAKDNVGTALWVSDGTKSGTLMLLPGNTADGVQGRVNQLEMSAVINNLLYFSYANPEIGAELWRSDGTVQGTYNVIDIQSGPNGASLESFNVINGVLFFVADDGIWGKELWSTDGTEAGTTLSQDFGEGPLAPKLWWFANINGQQLLNVRSASLGNELWAIDIASVVASPAPTIPAGNGGVANGNNGEPGANTDSSPKPTTDNSSGGALNLYLILLMLLYGSVRYRLV